MKKMVLVLGLLSLLLVSSVYSRQIGDFNDDGNINILDVMEFLNYLSGNTVSDQIGQEFSENSSAAENILFNTFPENVLGSDGVNEAIHDVNNIKEVNEMLIDELFQAWKLSRDKLQDNVITTISGQHSGTITWAGTVNGDSELEYVSCEAVFENYSRNGELFISGKFRYSDGRKLDLQHASTAEYDYIFLVGNCRITGRYSGYMWYHAKVIDWFQGDHYNYFGDFVATTKTIFPNGQDVGSFGGYLYKDNSGTEIPEEWRGGVVTSPDDN